MSPRRIAASRSGGGFFRYIGVMEQKFIRWLEDNFADVARAEDGFKNVLLGIGDDGAVLSGSTDKQVVVSDAIVDHVHFDLAVHSLSRVGHKALAVNLSDIAAMGAEASLQLSRWCFLVRLRLSRRSNFLLVSQRRPAITAFRLSAATRVVTTAR